MAVPHPHPDVRRTPDVIRLRRLHRSHGVGIVCTGAILTGAFLILIDYLANLSVLSRCFLQLVWLAAAGGLIWRFLISDRNQQATTNQTAIHWGGTGGALVMLAIAAITLVPGSGDRLQRVGMPWYRPGAISYGIVVSSGNPVVKRGEPLTLSAYVVRPDTAAIPEHIVLVFRVAGDPEEYRLPMPGDGAGAYHITLPAVETDLDYRVEAGRSTSEAFQVLVTDPVELAPGSTVERTPPPYAGSGTQRFTDVRAIQGLQFSVATLRFKFNRPAFSAELEWRPRGHETERGELISLTLDPDRRGATAEHTLVQEGTLRLVLLNENGSRKLRTEVPIIVSVVPDQPPRFEQIAGVSPLQLHVRPDERISIAFIAADDLGLSAAELEFAVGPEFRSIRVPIALNRGEGRLPFDFTGKAAEGQVVRLRVRVFDNRSIATPQLGPQEAVYPSAGWSEFRIAKNAPPLESQLIFGQRDALREALLAGMKDVRQAIEELKAIRADPEEEGELPLHHRIRITRARDAALRAFTLLDDSARDAALTPDLRAFAAAVRTIAEARLQAASEHLRKAATDHAVERLGELAVAESDLATAAVRIEELIGRNARLAQDRFDRKSIEQLSADQLALLDRAKGGELPTNLTKDEEALLQRLRKLISDSESLRRGSHYASGREARQLATEVRDLAASVKELDAATRSFSADTRKALLARAGDAQAESATAAAALHTRIEGAARIAGITPPRAEDFRRVAELIAQDKLVEALVALEKTASDLDRLASEFERWAAERVDAKFAARQLAAWQADLRTRLQATLRETPFAQLPDAAKMRFRLEQRIIRDAAARLNVSPDSQATDARGAALVSLNVAVEELDGDGRNFDGAMKAAHSGLTRLADRTPLVRDRLNAVRGELEKIRLEQDSILNLAEPLLRPALTRPADSANQQELAKKLTGVQEKQQKLAERLAALDLPGFEHRQARAAAALQAAADDLRDGLPFDSFASINWARREIERLRVALEAPPGADARADELAARQAGIGKDFAAFGPTPTAKQLEPLVFTQRDVQRQLDNFVAPECPALLSDAKEVVRLAELAFQPGAKPAESLQRLQAAADALKRLADRMNVAESDCDRIKRFSGVRSLAAEDARKLVSTPRNPTASERARRQLDDEIKELSHTRVGAAGQLVKQRVLRLYVDLQQQGEPDRQAGAQKAIAEALDDLAAKAAEAKGLASGWPREKEPAAPPPEDAFLPSKPMADAVRDLIRLERVVRDRVNSVSADAARMTRPAATDPLGPLEQKQRALADDLADLFRSTLATKDAGTAEAALQSRDAAKFAANALRLGQILSAKEHATLATARLRQLGAASEGKSWAKAVRELSVRQDALAAELEALKADSTHIAARLKAREAELTRTAGDLARRLDAAAQELLPGDLAARQLKDAATDLRAVEVLLAKDDPANRARAIGLLGQAENAAASAGGVKPGGATIPIPPAELATSDSLVEAEQAMKTALRDLAPSGDPAASINSMQKAANALQRAGQSIGER